MHYRTQFGKKRGGGPNLIEPYLSFKALSTFFMTVGSTNWILIYPPQNLYEGVFGILLTILALILSKFI